MKRLIWSAIAVKYNPPPVEANHGMCIYHYNWHVTLIVTLLVLEAISSYQNIDVFVLKFTWADLTCMSRKCKSLFSMNLFPCHFRNIESDKFRFPYSHRMNLVAAASQENQVITCTDQLRVDCCIDTAIPPHYMSLANSSVAVQPAL